jgi:hypothetical protein
VIEAIPPGHDDLSNEPNPREKPDGQIGYVKLPPEMPVLGGSWISVVIVVPTFASGQDSNEKIISTRIIGRVTPVSPQMSYRIHRPSDVPHHDDSNKDTPYKDARTVSPRLRDRTTRQQIAGKPSDKE